MAENSHRLRILTWNVQESYLHNLSRVPHDFYLPITRNRSGAYQGKTSAFTWPNNVYEVPASEIQRLRFDCILYQSRKQFLTDRFELLSREQLRIPQIYLEHGLPTENLEEKKHFASGNDVLLVHVSPFNALMWDSPQERTRVIEHGVTIPEDIAYTGEIDRGICAINHLSEKPWSKGAEIFESARREIPLDLVGLGWELVGGLGEIKPRDLPRFLSRYRFFFNPVRYSSLSLAVCEAMMIGLPIVGLATSGLAGVVTTGVSGVLANSVEEITRAMQHLLANPHEARRLSMGARRTAQERFNIERFIQNWSDVFAQVAC